MWMHCHFIWKVVSDLVSKLVGELVSKWEMYLILFELVSSFLSISKMEFENTVVLFKYFDIQGSLKVQTN
jgi:hypothetical protein